MKNNKIRLLLCAFVISIMLFAFPVIGSALDPKTPPDPINLSASQTSSTVTLKWEMPENTSATGFRVFRWTSKGWVRCVTTKGNTYTVKNLSPATKYTFAVRAYNKCSCGKIVWSQKYPTIKTTTAPGNVAKVYTNSASSYKVSWSAAKGANGYELYYQSFGKWVKFAETKGRSGSLVRLLPGLKYKLAVRPYLEFNGNRIYGAYKTFTATIAPKATKVEASSPEGGKLKISWSSVALADGYRVYYKLNNGSYRVYKDFEKPQDVELKNLKAGVYTVAVRAYMNTSDGRMYSGYTPVKVTVKPVDPTPDCPHD